jgi:hypothetical protein
VIEIGWVGKETAESFSVFSFFVVFPSLYKAAIVVLIL